MSDNDAGAFSELSAVLETGDPLTPDERRRLEALTQAVNTCRGSLRVDADNFGAGLTVGVLLRARRFHDYITSGKIR